MIWFVRACFGVTWLTCFGFLAAAETPAEWFSVSVALVLVPLLYIPMLEDAGDTT